MGHISSKGRLQDAGAPQTRHIVALGKNAIPLLIACLQDETKTKEAVVDFWPSTRIGDIAFFYLCDLFTDSTWEHSTIDGVVTWKTVEAEYPGSPSWTAWYEFVDKHGRKYVQNAWSKEWKEEKSGMIWDEKEHCFKVVRPATQGDVIHPLAAASFAGPPIDTVQLVDQQWQLVEIFSDSSDSILADGRGDFDDHNTSRFLDGSGSNCGSGDDPRSEPRASA